MDLHQAGLGSVYGRPQEAFPAIFINMCEWMLYSIQLREGSSLSVAVYKNGDVTVYQMPVIVVS